MAEFLDDFTCELGKSGLLGMYAQVLQDGKLLGAWSRFGGDAASKVSAYTGLSRLESYSISKSVAAIGAGIAIEEGLISLDEKIAPSLPEWTYDVSDPEILDITVRDLLTMASGMSTALFFRDSEERRRERDWGRYVYEHGQFGLRRSKDFLYSNVNPYLLGCLIERKYGANLLEYMRYRLFEPLDIRNPCMTQCPMGHTIVSNGLEINCQELIHFGQMLLDGGTFRGKRIVSEEFVKAALSPQIQTGDAPFWPSESEKLDYGFYFWIDSANHCSYAMGSFGQLLLILPDKNAVVAIQSLEYDTKGIAELVWKTIVSKL